jgi:sucrose-6-phosphate hydrolase SacC (GH32 family)
MRKLKQKIFISGKLLIVIFYLIALCFPACQKINKYNHKYRPQFHYSPQKNWMNDPNGLVYFDGEYHLFYQYNPYGNKWGHMSWGHAVSKDLVHWRELPVAIPEENGIMAFSGSAVVDNNNTSGFGKNSKIPIVAIYTGYRKSDKRQFQCLAYSLDHGRSWKKYKNNPVLDIGSKNFRDPHVFWYKPEQKWVMVVALPVIRKVSIYSSPDLINWEHLSDFGPAGETGGIWECPDLFPLTLEGHKDSVKWVMEVDLGSNSIAGGSGGQYFIGDFNGQEFIPDSNNFLYDSLKTEIPQGKIIEDFEGSDYSEWSITGNAFGEIPARGSLKSQGSVTGYLGDQLLNSYHNGDKSTGTAISPEFKITKGYINFLIGGGQHPGKTAINLIIEDSTLFTATGRNDEKLQWRSWNVNSYFGRLARIKIIDKAKKDWGHITIDHIMLNDRPIKKERQNISWVDYGRDFYAAITYANIPDNDGRTIWMGWMNNWDYAQEIPTHPWRSSQTIPRSLSLKKLEKNIKLIQIPIRELEKIRGDNYHFERMSLNQINNEINNRNIKGVSLEILLKCKIDKVDQMGIKVRKSDSEETIIGYDINREELFLDRRNSGEVNFHPDFPEIHKAPLKLNNEKLKLRIYIDRSSVEIFAGDGEVVITDRIFPSLTSDGLELYSRGEGDVEVISLDVWQLNSIWSK